MGAWEREALTSARSTSWIGSSGVVGLVPVDVVVVFAVVVLVLVVVASVVVVAGVVVVVIFIVVVGSSLVVVLTVAEAFFALGGFRGPLAFLFGNVPALDFPPFPFVNFPFVFLPFVLGLEVVGWFTT